MKDNAVPNKRLRWRRELAGWPRDYVAQRIQSDSKTVARWERGETFPSPYYRQKLCELFQMNAEELGLMRDDLCTDNQQHTGQSPLAPNPTESREGDEQKKKTVPMITKHVHTHVPFTFYNKSSLRYVALLLSVVVLLGAFLWLLPTRRLLASVFPLLPGGMWISPFNKQTIHDTISFAAHVYPTDPGDPPIDHVNFTVGWNGHWEIACTAYPQMLDTAVSCMANLKQLSAPAGAIQVSFDVYDKMGDINMAPNGVHTIMYAP